ncbi:MAG TPA: phosphoglycerate kinase [Patescibacteria group bacterium]|nr:phosphoglycerate kinase [Patescibacteria group bacterium]
MTDFNIHFIDEHDISHKRVLLRVDFNVSLHENLTIADDARIQQGLPTIKYLLEKGNKLILVSHLDRPEKRDPKLSLKPVVARLQEYLDGFTVKLVDDFLTEPKETFTNQEENEVLMLENIRFYPEEKKNDPEFAKKLAELADVYVNDAFGVCHRTDTSVVGVAALLPSYGGLLLKKEIEMISSAIAKPQKPLVAIIGGAKISGKIKFIGKLLEVADYLLVGGGLANNFIAAQGFEIGKSLVEYEEIENARRILYMAAQKNTAVVLPSDVVIGEPDNTENGGEIKKVDEVPKDGHILDIGPETQARFGAIIAKAKTIIWNGPVGVFENSAFGRGTDFIYYAITQNKDAISVIGGGETLAAVSKKEYLEKITHISTGGGAMLEFIEQGTLPGFEALNHA